MKQYELKSFDSFSSAANKETVPFKVLQNNSGKTSVFYPIDSNGHCRKCEDPEEIIKKAHEQAMLVEQEAYEKGFAQGEKDGLELGNAKAQKILENIEILLEKISLLRTDILKLYEKEILSLICAVAGKVIDQEIGLNGTSIKNTVIKAINLATEKRYIRLKVNPEDFDYIDTLRPEIFKRITELSSLEIVSSPSVKRGGCFLESPCGDVDARIETQLSIINKCLEDAYGGNRLD